MLEQTKKIVAFSVELANVGSKIIHKQGAFTLFQLSDEAMALASMDAVALKAEWAPEAFVANVQEVAVSAKAKLELQNKAVQAKVEKGIDLAAKGVVVGKSVFDLLGEVKQLFA